ncbi:oxidoreductase domain protein [Xylanimonas cellulosilytica DSM 15894]|uniref:Oxidoreductase domain protein n=1 Tax=Xylanimonas cellulosilytica (strain DSM 15894 / JCM 12276 / CECT 5975 / KCTC 9989 / LMG 20990 / NBRC 107835 / XIL07) TaxID=446471 RepID=D1BUB8_XYLCX|nr:Gfo/Idh/MocA family oxidoreductase [Xylanimonas cellulosilytica]ACZ31131.1 oxidoreductase domain protein [Xylanimonas cellulosilytica DSM 15894]
MSAPLRLGFVGLDHWYSAVPLAQAVAADGRTEVVAVADHVLDRAREVAGQVGGRATTSFDEVLADDSVDVIASFVSADLNPGVCVAAAAAGKHIVSVKPFARTLAEADRVVEAVRAAGVTFTPAESRSRTTDQGRLLHSWVASGRIGRIVSASFALVGRLPQAWPGATDAGWWVDPERVPGGAWIDHSLYQIDRMRWLLGEEVAEVSGRVANLVHPTLEVEDFGHAILRFDGGAIASVEDTWSGPDGAGRITTSIIGTDGAIAVDSSTGLTSVREQGGSIPGWQHFTSPSDYSAGVDEIVTAAHGGGALATVEDAWENLSVALAFYEAAATGAPVAPRHLGHAG